MHGINLRDAFFAIQQALSLMRRGGAIVVTGSIGGARSLAGNLVYGTANAGLRQMVRILAIELMGQGLRVNMVNPGPSTLRSSTAAAGPRAAVDEMRQQMIAAVPMRRMGEADEAARPVLFLAFDEAGFITRVELFVDGSVVEL